MCKESSPSLDQKLLSHGQLTADGCQDAMIGSIPKNSLYLGDDHPGRGCMYIIHIYIYMLDMLDMLDIQYIYMLDMLDIQYIYIYWICWIRWMIVPPFTFNDGNPEKLGGIIQLAMFFLVVEPLPICKLDLLLEVEVKRIYIYIYLQPPPSLILGMVIPPLMTGILKNRLLRKNPMELGWSISPSPVWKSWEFGP